MSLEREIELISPTSPLLIGLDRDGTVVPYAERPEDAKVDAALYSLLRDLAEQPHTTVCVVSARSLNWLRADFPDTKLVLAGNYGLEIAYPNGERLVHPGAVDLEPELEKVRDILAPLISSPYNAILEDHGLSLCLHWHTVPPEHRQNLFDIVEQITVVSALHHLQCRTMPTSWEFVPKVNWTKGDAMQSIDARLGPGERTYIFGGDTSGDEAAYAWVNKRKGISIKVGAADDTAARFVLATPFDLRAVLEKILQNRREAVIEDAESAGKTVIG